MNAINDEIVELIDQAIDYVDENGAGLVIGNQAGGMPGAFCAGGDLAFMAGLAKQGKYDGDREFLKKAQGRAGESRICKAFPGWLRVPFWGFGPLAGGIVKLGFAGGPGIKVGPCREALKLGTLWENKGVWASFPLVGRRLAQVLGGTFF